MLALGVSKLGQTTKDNYSSTKSLTASSLTTDDEILRRVAAGDPRAMDLCVTRFGGIVWSIARRYIKNQSEAEDLVQEVFIEIWKKAGSFNPSVASETTFVGLIARRRAIDHLRRQGRKPDFEPLSAAESLPLPNHETSSVSCDPEAVRSSLAEFPAETRQLFDLFFDEGFTHPEIAEKTGLPLGTVKTRLRRGLITLRDQLQRLGKPNGRSAS
jgi:RNA polymerase sigma factor (sigma-70 family)